LDLPDLADLADLADASLAQLEQRLERATARLGAARVAAAEAALEAASDPAHPLSARARADEVASPPAGAALAAEAEVLRELGESCRALFVWEVSLGLTPSPPPTLTLFVWEVNPN